MLSGAVLDRIQRRGAMVWRGRSARSPVPVPCQRGQTGPKGSTVVHGRIATCNVTEELKAGGTDDVFEWWLVSRPTSADLLIKM